MEEVEGIGLCDVYVSGFKTRNKSTVKEIIKGELSDRISEPSTTPHITPFLRILSFMIATKQIENRLIVLKMDFCRRCTGIIR